MTNKGGRVIDFGQILGQILSQICGFLSRGFDQVQLNLKKCYILSLDGSDMIGQLICYIIQPFIEEKKSYIFFINKCFRGICR